MTIDPLFFTLVVGALFVGLVAVLLFYARQSQELRNVRAELDDAIHLRNEAHRVQRDTLARIRDLNGVIDDLKADRVKLLEAKVADVHLYLAPRHSEIEIHHTGTDAFYRGQVRGAILVQTDVLPLVTHRVESRHAPGWLAEKLAQSLLAHMQVR